MTQTERAQMITSHAAQQLVAYNGKDATTQIRPMICPACGERLVDGETPEQHANGCGQLRDLTFDMLRLNIRGAR